MQLFDHTFAPPVFIFLNMFRVREWGRRGRDRRKPGHRKGEGKNQLPVDLYVSLSNRDEKCCF